MLDPLAFRNAMSRFASGVTIVTTRDAAGYPVGFTATAFSSLSLNPPLVLVCLERRADCFPVFEHAQQMAISVLAAGEAPAALRFATRGADKFGPSGAYNGPATGLPLMPKAVARIECDLHAKLDGGDHLILVGRVLAASSNDEPPLLHFNRKFGRFQPD